MLTKEQIISMSVEELNKQSYVNMYIGCTDCTDCKGCTDCKDCTDCFGCTDCIGCTGCIGCTDCTGCTGCKDCFGIISGLNLQYVVLEVQLTSEEYFSKFPKK